MGFGKRLMAMFAENVNLNLEFLEREGPLLLNLKCGISRLEANEKEKKKSGGFVLENLQFAPLLI